MYVCTTTPPLPGGRRARRPCAHPRPTLLTLLTPSTRPSTGASHLHTTMLDKIIAFITANPILFVAIAFRALLASNLATHRTTPDRARAAVAVIYKQWQAKQPWPDFGGRITSLKTAEAWQQLLSDADKAGKVVVVDAYATWCPPCKAAAPVYAKMSEEYSAETTVFAKFNTDEVRLRWLRRS